MRRKDREIIEFEKVISIIDACECCRLGLVDDNEAYIVPMNFGYEVINDTITLYFHCARKGRKIDILSKQRKGSFEMDTKHYLMEGQIGCDFSYLYQCVIGKGKIELLDSEEEKLYGLQQIMKHYTKKDNWNYESKMVDMIYVLKFLVEEWSCKEHRA